MFEQPTVRVDRVSYSIRGPEWAFAVPQGDLEALEEVIGTCSDFWNGIGSLIVPVRADGRLYPHLDETLAVRGVDQILLHEGLAERAREAIFSRFSEVGSMYEGFDKNEIHPLFVSLNDRPEALGSLVRPLMSSARLRRVALASWGRIEADDLPEWSARFKLADADGRAGLRHMLSSQIRGNTPLLLGSRYMDTFQQAGGFDGWPQLFVFDSASFNELVWFWNLRSRLSSWGGLRQIVGVPRELLSADELQPVRAWVEAPQGGTHYKPDISLVGSRQAVASAGEAFEELGFRRPEKGASLVHSFPNPPEGREALEYSPQMSGVGGEMKRGARSSALVTFSDGNAVLDLPPPKGIRLPFGHVRLAIEGLPLALPMNSVTAQQLIPGASVTEDGMTVITTPQVRPWSWKIGLPNQSEALDQWAAAHGFSVVSSQAGRYGQALIGRLAKTEDLDALADATALTVMGELTPLPAKKLAQRIVGGLKREAAVKVEQIDEAALVELLREEGLLLSVEAKTVHEIASNNGKPEAEYLPALAALVEAGLARRGLNIRCPQCNFEQLIPMQETDERIECRACRIEFPLPVLRGSKEYRASYFLDGLAARLMEQDLLSVILALRKARLDTADGKPFFAWPGLLFRRDGVETDADLLVSDGAQVSIFECKAQAASLAEPQATRLLELCEALGARPALAGLNGRFGEAVREGVGEAGGLIYERAELIGGGPV
jgi:hypothetical protein